MSANKFALESLQNLYLNDELADVKFLFEIKKSESECERVPDHTNKTRRIKSFEGKTFEEVPAHKNILAVSSAVFRAMFFGPLQEKDVVEIVDFSVNGFEEFLQLFYLTKVVLSRDSFDEVFRLADKYDMMDDLEKRTFQHWNDKDENLIWRYELSSEPFFDDDFRKRECKYAICRSTKRMFDSDTFLRCQQKTLKEVLQFNKMRCEETEILDACMAWAKHACRRNGRDENDAKNLRLELGDCFDLIRFGVMYPDEFIKHTASYRDMFTREEFEDILYKKSSKFTPNKFNHEPRLYFKGDLEYERDNIEYTCPRERNEDHPESQDREVYFVENTESVWFSSNKHVALTKIKFIPIGSFKHGMEPINENFEFNVKVIKTDAKDFKMGEYARVYDISIVTLGKDYTTISLSQPIYIDPENMYEIRLEVIDHPNPGGHFSWHPFAWNSEYECEDKFKIEFHQNPKKSKYHGLVSELIVKRLEWN